MGASGSFEFNPSGYLQGRIDWWEGDYDVGNNNSPVSAVLYARRTNNATTTGRSWAGWLEIDGQRVGISFSSSVSVGNGWVEMARISNKTIWHYDDGTRRININGSVTGPSGTSLAGNTSSGGQDVTLWTIPRTSSVSATSGNIGENIFIYINRASDAFRHTLVFDWGGFSGTITEKTAETTVPWQIPTYFYEKIPQSTSGTGTIRCDTYYNDNLIGSSYCNFTGYVSNSNPTIYGDVIDSNPYTVALTGNNKKLVKYMSDAYITANYEAKNSAWVTGIWVSCADGNATTSVPATFYRVSGRQFMFDVYDSRGLNGSNIITLDMIPYIKVAITEYSLERLSSTSNTLSLTLQGQWFNGNFGVENNTLWLRYRFKEEGAQDFGDWVWLTANVDGNTFRYDANLEGEFDFQKAYNFDICAFDRLNENTVRKTITAGIPLIDIWKDNVKINGNFLVNGDVFINDYYVADFNRADFLKAGVYPFFNTSANSPFSGWGSLIVFSTQSGYVQQVAIQNYNEGDSRRVAIRSWVVGQGYGKWSYIYVTEQG